MLLKSFRALRPDASNAKVVIAPPYDVINTSEARVMAADKPHSFLHVSRPEIDLPDGADSHEQAAYDQAAKAFAKLQTDDILQRDAQDSVYIYRMIDGDHVQTGVALTASVAAYDQNRVRRHELTRPAKENDRVRHIDAVNAQTGPVLCAFWSNEQIKKLIAAASNNPPTLAAIGPNQVEHQIWQVADDMLAASLLEHFNALDAIYIADGHHRSAAASRVAETRRTNNTPAETDASHEYFLTVVFPHDEMKIFDYNRVVTDLNGLSPEEFINKVGQSFDVALVESAHRPVQPAEFGMYVNGEWYRLSAHERPPESDTVASLDVSILQDTLIEPILGISDPRTDNRIDFVGGIRGLKELESRVDTGRDAVAFSLHPTQMDQLMRVADAELLMPPKSTWFEPKLADGLLSHVLD